MLRNNGVQMIVDVRSAPYSQYTPSTTAKRWRSILAEAEIEYVYAGEYLGGRPQDPTCYKHGKVPTGKVDYLKLVDYAEVARRPWYLKGIERLMQIASERPTAVMCSEEDPHHCHRYHLITPTLRGARPHRHPPASQRRRRRTRPRQPQQLSLF